MWCCNLLSCYSAFLFALKRFACLIFFLLSCLNSCVWLTFLLLPYFQVFFQYRSVSSFLNSKHSRKLLAFLLVTCNSFNLHVSLCCISKLLHLFIFACSISSFPTPIAGMQLHNFERSGKMKHQTSLYHECVLCQLNKGQGE